MTNHDFVFVCCLVLLTQEVLLSPTVIQYELTGLKPGSNYTVKVEGEKEGSYITVVSTEFLTGMLYCM